LRNLRFTTEHEWVRFNDGSDEVTVGITDFAAGELGDIVYIELPEVGTRIEAGDSIGTIEAVKTVADLYAPVGGEITATNGALHDNPEHVNRSPFEDGWFVRVRMSNRSQLDALLTHEAYRAHIGQS
jgi:glycine cleavage system H protein